MNEVQKSLLFNVLIVLALVFEFTLFYFGNISAATLRDEIAAVAFVITCLAVFEFGRFVDRHNRLRTGPRARPRFWTIDQSRNLVALVALALSCAVDATLFSADEIYKVIGFAALLGVLELGKSVVEDRGALAMQTAGNFVKAILGKTYEKLVEQLATVIVALVVAWATASLKADDAQPTDALVVQPEQIVSEVQGN